MKKKSLLSDFETLANLPIKVDYLLLKDAFASYKNPKKKIFDLMKKGSLKQIKRGLYFNLKSKQFETTSYEVLANSIYYPSYISMEWALQFYGLILERVNNITSVTILKSKTFKTPLGYFSYNHVLKNRYPIGYITKLRQNGESFFIARPEKALLDYVNIRAKNLSIKSDEDILVFLEEDLRLNLEDFFLVTKIKDLKELFSFYHRNSKEYRILKWLLKKKEIYK